ncbi:putative quinol monooxygenase [Amycolatopsis thermoflava]
MDHDEGDPMTELFELRQYTLHPGRRDELIALFDNEFVESQAEAGMRVYGQFRDLDEPDRFVWIRGFPDASRRATSLAAFYERHPAWLAHREAANATMMDSDDVLLLTPVTGDLDAARASPPARAGGDGAAGFEIVICHPEDPDAFPEFFRREVLPALAEAGAPPLASFRTSAHRNDYPRLPVREGEQVFVWLSRSAAPAGLLPAGSRPPQRLRLAPTPRSWLR